MKDRTTILLDRGLLLRLKRIAADEGRTLTSVISEGAREVIARARRRRLSKRAAPVLTTHDIGRAPFNISSRREMYDFFDQEDAARFR